MTHISDDAARHPVRLHRLESTGRAWKRALEALESKRGHADCSDCMHTITAYDAPQSSRRHVAFTVCWDLSFRRHCELEISDALQISLQGEVLCNVGEAATWLIIFLPPVSRFTQTLVKR